jgi:hypothetical protein
MADFFQTGAIATLHRLGRTDLPRLERELTQFTAETPIALVLPCHIRELGHQGPAGHRARAEERALSQADRRRHRRATRVRD